MRKTCFIICGPTAVGKTGFSLQLAGILNTSIISADSRQCYRELNIGVAKPSPEELAIVPHYFINSHSIFDEVNAAGFAVYAEAAATQIMAVRDTAVMVGGTGLYIDAFCKGMDEIPPIDPAIRIQLRQQYEKMGLAWLQAALMRLDPAFAESADMANPQRMLRALEVVSSTGISIRSYQRASQREKPYRVVKVGLELQRDELYQRINQRVDDMVSIGLVKEVSALAPYRGLNALNTVGYKELTPFFEGVISMTEAVELIKQHTRQYAKRQLTWFKRDAEIRWFNPGNLQDLLNYCVDIANKLRE